MTDILERIRKLRYVHVPVASELMAEAAAEIERLRLTDEEREAIYLAAARLRTAYVRDDGTAATLNSLLERLHT
jgi:hypothetical protein